MNQIILIGRAGRDPETKFFESGSCVAKFTLAVSGFSRDDEPEWFNIEAWGKTAQVVADYVKKGSQVAILGSMKTEKWTDRTSGQERSRQIVKVGRLVLLGSKRDTEQSQPDPADVEVPFCSTTSSTRAIKSSSAASAKPSRFG